MSGKKEILYKSEERMSREALASFLRDLASRIESGKVVLRSSGGETPVDLPEQVKLEVEYETKAKGSGARQELELEISWGSGDGVGLA